MFRQCLVFGLGAACALALVVAFTVAAGAFCWLSAGEACIFGSWFYAGSR